MFYYTCIYSNNRLLKNPISLSYLQAEYYITRMAVLLIAKCSTRWLKIKFHFSVTSLNQSVHLTMNPLSKNLSVQEDELPDRKLHTETPAHMNTSTEEERDRNKLGDMMDVRQYLMFGVTVYCL